MAAKTDGGGGDERALVHETSSWIGPGKLRPHQVIRGKRPGRYRRAENFFARVPVAETGM